MTGKIFRTFLMLSLFAAAWPSPVPAQSVIGQYEEEAPLGTWNILGPSAASGLGCGGAMFTLASDPSVIFTNPALATRLPGLTVSVGASLLSASLYRFGPVNTGILSSDENLSLGLAALELAAVTLRVRGWTIGLGAALSEMYDRPVAEAGSSSYNATFTFRQSGALHTWNLSLGREVFPGVSLGLGFNLVSGNWDWELVDSWNPPSRLVTITDERARDFGGFFINGGLLWRVSDRLDMAAAFRTPYRKHGRSRSSLRYQSAAGPTDILIEAEGEDSFRQPAVLGIGLAWKAIETIKLVGEVSYWNWSSYAATSFGEELPREFRDAWRAGLGLIYRGTLRIFKRDFDIPSSLGLLYDRQPVTSPGSAYLGYTLGTGLHARAFRLDLAAVMSFEQGSGRSLIARKITATLTFCAGQRPAEE